MTFFNLRKKCACTAGVFLIGSLQATGLFAATPLFTASPGSPIAVGVNPAGVATGDFNGDGKQDIAVVNSAYSTITILLGDGTGKFTEAAGSPISDGNGTPYAIIAKDFNKDNKIDLAVLNLAGTVAVFLGNGIGGFAPAPGGPMSVTSPGGYMATADFNGDGVPDLAVSNYGSNKLTVLLGDGAGGFSAGPGSPFATGHGPTGVATGDFNKDGKMDIVVANTTDGTSTVLLGNGSGGFTVQPTNYVTVLPGVIQTGNSYQTAIAVGDFYTHGTPDLITLSSGVNQVNLNKGDGVGGFSYQTNVSAYQNPEAVLVWDFDGDGFLDVAVATTNTRSVDLFPGNGAGGLNFQTGPYFATGASPVAIAMADFNGDGKMDIVVSNNLDNTLTVLLTSGAPVVPPVVPPVTPPVTPSAPVAAQQTITFIIGDHLGSDLPFPLTATASSGLPVTFSLAGGPATLSGNTVTLTGLGPVFITASQAGNTYYAPASVTQVFKVSLGTPSITSVVNGASFAAGQVPNNYYATVFGSNLVSGSSQGDATSSQSLGGTSLTVVDSLNQSFTPNLFFMSYGQINFVVPRGLAAGPGTLTVTNKLGKSASIAFTGGAVAPGLFSANGTGTGQPSGQALVIAADGTQTLLSTSFCTPFSCTPPTIPLVTGTQVYLILFGTGIRGRSSLGGVSMTIGGKPATVLYAGSQGGYPGLDQLDVIVPASLAGAGLVDIKLTVDGLPANTLQIKLQ